jgi:LuxR family maltose regulon positive regulatory protein
LAELQNALILAEPEGYIRLFVDEGKVVQQMLREVSSGEKTLQEYIQRLAAAFYTGQMPSTQPTVAPEAASDLLFPCEPLSRREEEVLHLLPGQLSVEEIANQLYVSVHTVRSHIKSIYSKLGVHGRLEAVEEAKARKLL